MPGTMVRFGWFPTTVPPEVPAGNERTAISRLCGEVVSYDDSCLAVPFAYGVIAESNVSSNAADAVHYFFARAHLAPHVSGDSLVPGERVEFFCTTTDDPSGESLGPPVSWAYGVKPASPISRAADIDANAEGRHVMGDVPRRRRRWKSLHVPDSLIVVAADGATSCNSHAVGSSCGVSDGHDDTGGIANGGDRKQQRGTGCEVGTIGQPLQQNNTASVDFSSKPNSKRRCMSSARVFDDEDMPLVDLISKFDDRTLEASVGAAEKIAVATTDKTTKAPPSPAAARLKPKPEVSPLPAPLLAIDLHHSSPTSKVDVGVSTLLAVGHVPGVKSCSPPQAVPATSLAAARTTFVDSSEDFAEEVVGDKAETTKEKREGLGLELPRPEPTHDSAGVIVQSTSSGALAPEKSCDQARKANRGGPETSTPAGNELPNKEPLGVFLKLVRDKPLVEQRLSKSATEQPGEAAYAESIMNASSELLLRGLVQKLMRENDLCHDAMAWKRALQNLLETPLSSLFDSELGWINSIIGEECKAIHTFGEPPRVLWNHVLLK